MISRRTTSAVLLLLACAASVGTVADSRPIVRPGPLGWGITLLPNGWKIAPAGRHIQVGDLPLAMAASPDGRWLLVSNNGYAPPSVSVVDVQHENVRATLPLDHAWLGLAWHPDGRRVFVSGAADNTVHELTWDNGTLEPARDIAVGPPYQRARSEDATDLVAFARRGLVGGLAVSADGARLFVVNTLGQSISAIDLESGRVTSTASLPAEAYTCVLSRDGRSLFVSLWGGGKVLEFDPASLALRGEIPVGDHPNAMAITNDDRLLVACANTNAVFVIDLASRRPAEQVSVAMFPAAPPGTTPNHVSLSPDGTQALVSNADNNTVAVLDIAKPGATGVVGFIPTGWYPTAAAFSRDGRQIFVLSGKGLSSAANPRFGPNRIGYIASLLTGTLSILPAPDRDRLQTLTKMALDLTPYSDAHRLSPVSAPPDSPVPAQVGRRSPIEHVFYVIRENRTYDQVLGDIGRGNSDPSLCLFGEDVTPNAHAIAREFGLLDNFYVDAEVSYDGHAWSMAAYATDFVEKIWPLNYAERGGVYLSEGGGAERNPYGNIAAASDGYIWDAAVRQGVTVRSYGEFAHWGPGSAADRAAGRVPAIPSVAGLQGRVDPEYPPWDLSITDNRRVDLWARDFTKLDTAGSVPALSIIRLGNDHTNGTRAGWPTPRAMVAENDEALGRLVEIVSRSRIWRRSVIFVVEDDAQNGPDHVDAHRSPALVISPFSRRRVVDSTLYTTSGLLRTIELILGLPPMSQYDAAAAPMYHAFQPSADASVWTHVPHRIPLDEKNDQWAWGASASERLDFTEADRVPDRELTEIIWHAVRGPHSPVPPVVRSAFVRPRAGLDDDDR